MARKQKGSQELIFSVLGDVSGLQETTTKMLRIMSSFVKGINKRMAKIGQISSLMSSVSQIPVEGVSRIEEQRERISPDKLELQREVAREEHAKRIEVIKQKELDANREILRLQELQSKIKGKGSKSAKEEMQKQIDGQKTILEKLSSSRDTSAKILESTIAYIDRLERMYNLGEPVVSSRLYGDQKKKIDETVQTQYFYSGEKAQTLEGANVDLLQREITTTQKIKNLVDGTTDTYIRTVVEQQKLVNGTTLWEKVLDTADKSTTKLNTKTEKLRKNMQSVSSRAEVLKEQLRLVENELTKQGLSEKKVLSLAQRRLSLQKQIEKAQNPKKAKRKDFFSTLFERFKSVAIYRTIRNTLKEIVNAFTESLSGIAIKSDAFNESFSKITSSIKQVKYSMGVAFYQILIVLQPIITNLSNIVVNFANGLAYLMAKLTGASSYLKINTEYFKDYRDSINGALLEFDDFTTLSSNTDIDYSKMFKEVKTDTESWAKGLGDAIAPLTTISTLVGLIFGPKILGWIKQTTDGIKTFYNSGIMPIASTVSGIFLVIDGIFGIINWDEQTHWLTKVLDLIKLIAGTLAVVFGIWSMITKGSVGWVKAVAGISAAVGLAGTVVGGIAGYENGGNFRTGDFFVANENGNTELIASSNSGGGSVMNLDQWAQISEASFFNALSRYDAAQNGGSGGLDMDKLGTAIARSSGFRNEINRRNVGLNLV